MQLTVLHGDAAKARATVAPLHRWRSAIRRAGIDLRLTRDPEAAAAASGILLVVETGLRGLLGGGRGRAEELDLVDRAERRGTRVVWFDDADHAGRVRGYLLDRVSVYAKAQLPTDRTELLQPSRSGVPTWDRLAALHDVEVGPSPEDRTRVAPAHLARVAVGWDLAYSPRIWGPLAAARLPERADPLLRWFPSARSGGPPFDERPAVVTARAGAWSAIPVVAAHRAAVRDAVVGASAALGAEARVGGGLSLREYRDEMAASRAVVSPFGIGELCYRDYEAAVAGAVCVKPDVSHLETFPGLLQAGTTYLPVAWDLSDVEEALACALDPATGGPVAAALRDAYADALGSAGRDRFVDHVRRLAERATSAPTPAGG
jgi:hypothetical protein